MAVLQKILPQIKAILLDIRGRQLTWHVEDFEGDEDRRLYHDRKMASKDSRPAMQLEALGIRGNFGIVTHIVHIAH